MLLWIGGGLMLPYALADAKDWENLTPIARLKIVSIIILLPFVVFGFIYFYIIKK
jgi:hypothetical protein